MTTHTWDSAIAGFELADRAVETLTRRLSNENVCPCCTAWALAYRAADMAVHVKGRAKAITMLEEIIGDLREGDVPLPDRSPSAETH